MKNASPCLCHASWAEHSQSEKQDENRMELGHDDESIASKISKACFRWSVKAISYHVSKCNPRAISSQVTPSAALSYRTVKLRCLGTLLCLVLSNFRAPKSYNKHGEIARNTLLGVQIVQTVPLAVQTRQLELIEHLRMKKKLRNVSPSI